MVYLLPTASGQIAVNPRPIEVVIPGEDDRFQVVSGFQPHWMTCVDVSTRGHKLPH